VREFRYFFRKLEKRNAVQRITNNGLNITLIHPSDFIEIVVAVMNLSAADSTKYYKMLFPVIAFQLEPLRPIRPIGWGQMDVAKNSPLYRYGEPIRLQEFKFILHHTEEIDQTLREMQEACGDLTRFAKDVEEHDRTLEEMAKIKRSLANRSESADAATGGRLATDSRSTRRGGGWCGLWSS